MSDMTYIRTRYQVPARMGAPVTYYGDVAGRPQSGKVVGSNGIYVLVRLDGEQVARPYHPTWCMTWPEENGPASRVPTFPVRPAPAWPLPDEMVEPQWSGV